MFRKMKRRIEKKTDYNQRLGLLKSGKPRIVIRKSLSGILSQIVEYYPESDKVILTLRSGELKKFGWLGASNLPSAYLTGLLIGVRAKEKGITEAILDIGMQISTKGNTIYAFAKGCNDAGLLVSVGSEIIPSDDRIKGKHIETNALRLKKDNPELYQKYYSSYLKNGLKPEELTAHFEKIKAEIIKSKGKR